MRISAVLALCLAIAAPAAAQNVVRYEPKESDLKFVFGVAPPVATVKPGDIIDTRTFDCFGNVIQKPGDTLAEHGGNMDAPEASVGNTAYFPVNVRGALLYLGDGHAAMGDGEIAGTAIEVPMHARVQVDVIKGQTIGWPRFENARQLMAVGAYRPLDDALRIAFTELIGWIRAETTLSDL